MAAGDVVINTDSGRAIRGYRIITGNVTLDGVNPTPVALVGRLGSVLGATVSFEGTAAPGLDPTVVTSAVSGTTLNVYAWKPTSATDTTLIASTNNARLVNFTAWGLA